MAVVLSSFDKLFTCIKQNLTNSAACQPQPMWRWQPLLTTLLHVLTSWYQD